MQVYMISLVVLGLVATSFGDNSSTTPKSTTTGKVTTTPTTKPDVTTTPTPKPDVTTTTGPAKTTTVTEKSTTVTPSTTKRSTVTKMLPTTTAVPTATPVYSVIHDGNVTCLKLQANISVSFSYTNATKVKVDVNSNVPRDAQTTGECMDSYNEISLSWDIKTELEKELKLKYTKSGDKYSLTRVYFSYTYLHAGSSSKLYAKNITSTMETSVGSSYKCAAGVNIDLDGAKVAMNDVISDAFMSKESKPGTSVDFESTGNDCSNNGKTDAIVPIAVGAALAAMVLIVLIGYCIGRRRTAAGYQTMTNA